MPWTWAAATCRGTSHARAGTRCQDQAACVTLGPSASTLLAIVSDGAGSASFGGQGAALVCRSIITRARAHFRDSAVLPTEAEAWTWVDDARDRIAVAATRRNIERREFAATLVAVIIGDDGGLILHVGDGAAVVKMGDVWLSPSWPESGEYASTTFFVTEDPAPQLRLTRIESAERVAVFSDGLERLILDFAHKEPHAPFFERMFGPVEGSERVGKDKELTAALRRYLDSAPVNERTDDDKSLILAFVR